LDGERADATDLPKFGSIPLTGLRNDIVGLIA